MTSSPSTRWVEVFVVFLSILYSFTHSRIFKKKISMHLLPIPVLDNLIPHIMSLLLRNSTHLEIWWEVMLESSKHNAKTFKYSLSCSIASLIYPTLSWGRMSALPPSSTKRVLHWALTKVNIHNNHGITEARLSYPTRHSPWPASLLIEMMHCQSRLLPLQLRVIIWAISRVD